MKVGHVVVLQLLHVGCCIQIFEWQRDWGDGIFTRELAQVLPEMTQVIHSATESNVPSNVPAISLYHYQSNFVEFTNGLLVIRPLLSEDHQICFIGQISGHWSIDYNTLQYRHGATIASDIPETYDLDLGFPGNFDPLSLTSVTDFCGVDRNHIFYLKKTSNLLPNTTVLNIQGLFGGYAVMVPEEMENVIFVPPLSKYSKLLVTASCEYEKGQGHSTSHYCPGYSDAKVTPYEGIKTEKLTKMAEVFCSHCTSEDFVCQQLFCSPDILMVNITQTVLGSFCDAIETDFPSCHSEFCTSPLARRGVRGRDMNYPSSSNLNGQLSCQASLPWAGVAGMNAWCKSNCVNGYDGVTCTEQYCDCSAPQTTTTASVVGNQPTDVCTEWEANPTYAGTAGIDVWCQSMCSSGSCPLSHCQCKAKPTPTSITTTARTTTTAKTTSASLPTTTTTEASSPVTTARQTTSTSRTTERTTPRLLPTTTERTTSTSLPTTTTTIERITTSLPVTTVRQTTSTSRTTERPTTTMLPTTTERTISTLSVTTTARTRSTTASPTSSSPISTEKITSQTTSARPTTSPAPTERTPSKSLPSTTIETTTTFTSGTRTTTSGETTTMSGTTTTTISGTTTTSGTATTIPGTSTPTTTSGTTTSTLGTANVTDDDSFSIVNQIVCDHATFQGQNMVTGRFCHREGQGQNEAARDKMGFSRDIIDQIFSFTPKILCSLTDGSARTDTCANMFCGESPLSQRVIRTAMCSVCEIFIAEGYTDCFNIYC